AVVEPAHDLRGGVDTDDRHSRSGSRLRQLQPYVSETNDREVYRHGHSWGVSSRRSAWGPLWAAETAEVSLMLPVVDHVGVRVRVGRPLRLIPGDGVERPLVEERHVLTAPEQRCDRLRAREPVGPGGGVAAGDGGERSDGLR